MIDQQLTNEVMRLHAQICAALAEPTRILILYSLSEKPYSVGELVKIHGVNQPTVSRHLQNLRNSQLVNATREGQSVVYSLSDARVIQALDLLRSVLADQLSYQGQLAENTEVPQNPGRDNK
jgi:DNA-binding transcriptional ArsR family regulator